MQNISNINAYACFILWATLTMGITSCGKHSFEGWIVATQVPAEQLDSASIAKPGRIPTRPSRIIAFDPGKADDPPTVLSKDFYSARHPALSWDARFLLFSARNAASDPWQVWIMRVKDHSMHRVTHTESDCMYPVYLPDDRIAYTGTVRGDSGRTYLNVFTCNQDGTDTRQVTFHPHNDRFLSVMQDGRLLFMTRQLYPEPGEDVFMAVRPDGTKAELFYKPGGNYRLTGIARETPEGELVFAECRKADPCMAYLTGIRINRPLFSARRLFEASGGGIQSAYPLGNGRYIVSFRNTCEENYSLLRFDVEMDEAGSLILHQPGYHLIDPLGVRPAGRPRKLPSAVKPEETAGSLLCQDIRRSTLPSKGVTKENSTGIVEFWGLDGLLGSVKAEEDGSIYVRITADTPFRIRTVNASGMPLRGPSAWLWVRPNERRGCVGCHADPELAPVNRVPLAVKKVPVNIPPME